VDDAGTTGRRGKRTIRASRTGVDERPVEVEDDVRDVRHRGGRIGARGRAKARARGVEETPVGGRG
jgi:hypothetical protein